MNLPNKLTLSRFVMTFFFIYFISRESLAAMMSATFIFSLASFTDYLDGYLAKKNNQISDFGVMMDPIADKFLILAAFIAFVRMQIVDDWMVVVILGREIIVTGFRLFAMSRGKVLAAERAGKHKTVSQIVAIFSILGLLIFRASWMALSQWSMNIETWWQIVVDILMLITVVLTLISGISFMIKNRKLLHLQ